MVIMYFAVFTETLMVRYSAAVRIIIRLARGSHCVCVCVCVCVCARACVCACVSCDQLSG